LNEREGEKERRRNDGIYGRIATKDHKRDYISDMLIASQQCDPCR
jgi:hypothetical protein